MASEIRPAVRAIVMISWVVCSCTVRPVPSSVPAPLLRQMPMGITSLRLRGGRDETEDLSGEGEDQPYDKLAAARHHIGRFLDEAAQHWKVDKSVPDSTDVMFQPRLRSDWRGPPVAVAGGYQFITRAGAAKRFNAWLRSEQSHLHWTRYTCDVTGRFVPENVTYWPEAEYGVGGRPGWMGYGAIPLEEVAEWCEKGNPSMHEEVQRRELYEFREFGLPPIFSEGPEDWKPNHELIPPSFHGAGAGNSSLSSNVSGINILDGVLDSEVDARRKAKTARCVWTREEDQTLVRQFRKHASSWTEVCKLLPGRTTNACKNRWTKLLATQPDILNGMLIEPPADTNTSASPDPMLPTGVLPRLSAKPAAPHPEKLDPRLVEILRERKDDIRLMASQNPGFAALTRGEKLQQSLRLNERLKQDPYERHDARMARVDNATVLQLMQDLQEAGVDASGQEEFLRLLCASCEGEKDVGLVALHRYYLCMAAALDPDEVAARQRQAIRNETIKWALLYEDLLMEREIRNDTMRRFKNVDGRLVEVPRRDPFNHSKNRDEMWTELDPRIEQGLPTEYDRQSVWIYHEENRKWLEGGEPDWTRLTTLVEEQELAARNGSGPVATPGQVFDMIVRRQRQREAVREFEKAAFSDKRYAEMAQQAGLDDDVVPAVLRHRTLGQGGVDENGTIVYGDGTYPYNPSPFKDWVDGDDLLPGELGRLDYMLDDDPEERENGTFPWRQHPYFSTSESRMNREVDVEGDVSFLPTERYGTVMEGMEEEGAEALMKGKFGRRYDDDRSVSVLARGMLKAFGGKTFGVKSKHAEQVMNETYGMGGGGRDGGGMAVMAKGLKRSLAASKGQGDVGKGRSAEGGDDVMARGLRRSLEKDAARKETAGEQVAGRGEEEAEGRGRIVTDWRTQVEMEGEDDFPRAYTPQDKGYQVIGNGGIEQIEAEFPDYYEHGGGMVAHGNPWEHSASVIFLHAEGEEGGGWVRIQLALVFEWVNFIFPNAKVQEGPISLTDTKGVLPPPRQATESSAGAQQQQNITRSWFSIVQVDAPNGKQQTVEDAKSLSRSAAFVLAHVQAEVDKGIDPSRILLVGFGQGGATALMAACHTVKHRVGGVICIAGWLPFRLPRPLPQKEAVDGLHHVIESRADTDREEEGSVETASITKIKAEVPKEEGMVEQEAVKETFGPWNVSGVASEIPVWLLQGTSDDVVPLGAANYSANRLVQMGFRNVSVEAYEGKGHKVCAEMMESIHELILELMPKQPSDVEYIPVDKFIDYSQSRRSTGRSLPDRRAMPSEGVFARLDPDEMYEGKRLPVTGSRMVAPSDKSTSSSSEEESDHGNGVQKKDASRSEAAERTAAASAMNRKRGTRQVRQASQPRGKAGQKKPRTSRSKLLE